MAKTVIDGWRCYVAGDGIRHAESNGGFSVQLDKHGGLAGDNCYAPPAVVLWLIRPLLHEAWEDGATTALRQALRQGPMPDLRNPYEGGE